MMSKKTLLLLLLFGYVINTFSQAKRPNIIYILTDDQGYNDLGCYGSPTIKTPNIDKLAAAGLKFTNYYVNASVCTASRASFITGRFPNRHGLGTVIYPDDPGLSKTEITIAQLLQQGGYATACIGKWHLGDHKSSLPTSRGFDEYFGIPYSNDMYISPALSFAATVKFNDGYHLAKARADQDFIAAHKNQLYTNNLGKQLFNKVPLLENDSIIEYPCDQSIITRRYFDKALEFIDKNKKKPFFIYLTPSMPHVPLFAGKKFEGKSKGGVYGDVIEEMDAYIGELVSFLKAKNLYKNTIIVYTSDNGPWLSFKDLAGSAAPFNGGKFTNYEGGVRMPAILSWPKKLKSGYESSAIISAVDWFPTFCNLAGVGLPKKTYDGLDISTLLKNPENDFARKTHYYHISTELAGIRLGEWKYLPYGIRYNVKDPGQALLFNLKKDISESTNLIHSHKEKAKEMDQLFKEKQLALDEENKK